jgi:hypothetical protein
VEGKRCRGGEGGCGGEGGLGEGRCGGGACEKTSV